MLSMWLRRKNENKTKGIIITDVKSIEIYKENELIMSMEPRKEHKHEQINCKI